MTTDKTKYGEMIEDHEWTEPDDDPEVEVRTSVKHHEIEVYHDDQPDPDDNYDRTRYTIRIRYEDDTDEPIVLYAIGHRWKGNYWRDVTDWDWRDLPEAVRQTVVSVLPVDSPADLDSGVRLIDEGGESRFEKIHKPQMEAYDNGGEMWAESSLREAVGKIESAAEQLENGSDLEGRAEELVTETQRLVGDLGGEKDAE